MLAVAERVWKILNKKIAEHLNEMGELPAEWRTGLIVPIWKREMYMTQENIEGLRC